MPLLTLAKLLARAIVNHLGDYAVVVDPSGTSLFYTASSITNLPPTLNMAAVEAESDIIWNGLPPRLVHYLVINDPALAGFLGVATSYFDVVTPFISYAHKFLPIAATMLSWLLPTGRPMPAVLLPSSTSGHAGNVTIYAIDDGWNAPHPPERDSCRMRLTPVRVNAAAAEPVWANVNAATRATFERWARTVTWRRVGVSISGGGASVFRLVPLFKALEAEGLPIDFMAGVSGGTVLAACYAVGGMPKVLELANQGTSFLVAITGALLTSWTIQRYIDNFLNDCGVCNTEIRVLPISMRTSPMSPPQATALVDGTFGQAIRASGGAPFFAPYFVGDSRQSDGDVLAGLPPPFLAERFGADIVFAMNVLAMPANRFPGETIPFVGDVMSVFYRYTPLGRVADLWGASSTMLHTIAEGYGLNADVFVDTPPRDWGPFEPFLFYNSVTYSNIGLGPGVDVAAVATDCVQRWRALP
jgi:predicted acylesterase/phospholipase RssA